MALPTLVGEAEFAMLAWIYFMGEIELGFKGMYLSLLRLLLTLSPAICLTVV